MTVKSVMENITAKKPLLKKALIVTGAVVGIALTAGLIVKNKSALDKALEPAIEAISDLAS